MKVIVGLGNPTREYEGTRHNVGFAAADFLAGENRISIDFRKHKALYGKGVIGFEKVIIAKPQTYMNLSGESVRELVDFYKVDPANDLIVIYDDISLPPGQLRIRKKGSAGGHNGIKNILSHLGTDEFLRIKMGVGEKPSRMDLADYVLGRFSKDESQIIEDSLKDAADAIKLLLEDDLNTAMNLYNKKKVN